MSLLDVLPDERRELERRVRSRALRADDARRARLILMLASGETYASIRCALKCNANYISRWKGRFEEDRLSGLSSRHGGGGRVVLTPALEACILERTRRAPSDGSTQWTTRKLGRAMSVSHTLISKAWQRAGLKPHRFERYMAPDDPAFEEKAADVIGLT